jgi:Ctr copper transporter family
MDRISQPFHFIAPSALAQLYPCSLLFSRIIVFLPVHFIVPADSSSMTDHSGHTMNMTMDDSMMMSDAASSSSFCDPSMTMAMYMMGFEFALTGNQPCLNLYFASWTLNSVGKFVAAMIGVFLLAVSVEGIAKFRVYFVRSARVKSWEARRIRTCVTLLHGFHAFLGYAVMLAVMTYSAELLIVSVAGLATGYAVFFSLQDDLDGVHVAATPCCAFMMDEAKEGAHQSTATGSDSDTPLRSRDCCDAENNIDNEAAH